MRLLSILSAIIVVAVLFLLVFQRDSLLEFAGADTEAPETESAGTDSPAPEADDKTADDRVSVVAIQSRAATVDGAVILRGRTEAARQVDVRAETSGQVISEPLRKGTFVDADDLLCQLDPGTREAALSEARARLIEASAGVPTAEARLAEAKARLDEAEINGNAASRLSEGGFASETRVAATNAAVEAARAGVQSSMSGVESARAAIQAAEAAVARAEEDLTNLEIKAPFAGLMESDAAELGSLLQPGSLCATIIQLDPIRLVGFVPETMVDRVNLGAMAGAQLASGREVVGEVTFLSRSADPSTRTFRVDIEVANPNLEIRDGQTAEIAIQSDGEMAHKLPQSALTLNDVGRLGVRLVNGDAAIFAPVDVLRDAIDGIWVTGLNASAEVIVVGQEFVTDGVLLDVTYQETNQ